MKFIVTFLCLAFAIKAVAQTHQEVVAAVLISEAGGEGLRGMQAVLEVVHTRARQTGLNLYLTVVAPFQFSCLNQTSPKSLVKKSQNHPLWAEALRLARVRNVKTNLTRGANHYHEITIDPGWPAQSRTTRIGRHIFYKFA